MYMYNIQVHVRTFQLSVCNAVALTKIPINDMQYVTGLHSHQPQGP